MSAPRAVRFLPRAARATLHALRGELNVLAGAGQVTADPASRRALLRIGQLADELEWRLVVADRAPAPVTTLDLGAAAAEVAFDLQAAGYPVALAVASPRVRPTPVTGNAWLVREILGLLVAQALNHVLSAAEVAPVTLAAAGRAVSLSWRCDLAGPLRRAPVAAFFRPVEEQPGALRGFALGLYAARLLAERQGGRVTFTRRLRQGECRSRLILPPARREA